MSQIELKPIDCPHCKGKIEVEIERKPAKVVIQKEEKEIEIDKVVEAALAKRLDAGKAADVMPKEEKPKDDPDIPSHVAKYHCKGCGSLHTNKKFKGLPLGKCDTCGEKFNSKKSGKCPYCKDGEIEELSDDDLEEMGIFLPDEDEHNHE